MDWKQTDLPAQLDALDIGITDSVAALAIHLSPAKGEASTTCVLKDLSEYAQSWGDPAAVWLVLAVTRMIREICADFSYSRFGIVPPDTFSIVSAEEDQQEIAHQCLTAYQDIYDVLLRTHRKPSSPIWHRRAVTQYFPQLILDIETDGVLLDNGED